MEKKIKTFALRIGSFFADNWVTGIIALFVAIVLWGFVLTSQNPERTKTISGVQLSFEGEADLIARQLVVQGDREDILSDVTVRVSTDLLNYANLDASDISATVSLRNVSKMGTYELNIHATSTMGTVLSVSPSTITVDIDRLTTKRIPVEITTAGEKSANLWYSTPELSRNEVEIEGALSVLSNINRAVGVVDISDKTTTFSDAVTLSLMDLNGNEIEATSLYGEVPSVTVTVEILSQKTVPFDLEGALTGVDSLPANYEISSMLTIPNSAVIIGEQSVLDNIDSLALSTLDVLTLLDRITVAGEDAEDLSGTPVELDIIIPDGVRIQGDITTVDVYVNIREKIIERTFIDIPITIINQSSDLSYSIVIQSMDVTISGKISLLNNIDESDIELYIDVANLPVGMHSVVVNLGLEDTELLMQIAYTLERNEISVAIAEKQ